MDTLGTCAVTAVALLCVALVTTEQGSIGNAPIQIEITLVLNIPVDMRQMFAEIATLPKIVWQLFPVMEKDFTESFVL